MLSENLGDDVNLVVKVLNHEDRKSILWEKKLYENNTVLIKYDKNAKPYEDILWNRKIQDKLDENFQLNFTTFLKRNLSGNL